MENYVAVKLMGGWVATPTTSPGLVPADDTNDTWSWSTLELIQVYLLCCNIVGPFWLYHDHSPEDFTA